MLVLGVPKEIKPQEKRVGLDPESVHKLVGAGVSVLVESGAGMGSQFDNRDYEVAGASILRSAEELYQRADMIQKVKEPLPPEYRFLRKHQILFCFLHLASQEQCKLVDALCQSGATAIAFETLSEAGVLPILAPMSHIAGGLSGAFASYLRSLNLKTKVGGKGMAYPDGFGEELENIGGFFPQTKKYGEMGRVLIFGGGVAGLSAANVATELGAEVTLVEMSGGRRKVLEGLGLRSISPEEVTLSVLAECDVYIGSAHSKGSRAVRVLSEEIFKLASEAKSKVIMDIAIDQGGNFPLAKSTTYEDPIFQDVYRNIRFSVPNLPSLSGASATRGLSQASLPYTLLLVKGLDEALLKSKALKEAVNIRDHQVVTESIKQVHKRG